MSHRGFTIVELVVVITIMGILMVLGVVNLESSQANGRDAERKIDVDTIALQLETYYTSGNDFSDSTSTGRYPAVDPSATEGFIGHETTYLRDLDAKSITAPDEPDGTDSLIAATNAVQSSGGVLPRPVINQYVYQPLKKDGSGNWVLCDSNSDECLKYNLYWQREVSTTECSSTFENICMVTSRNQ